MNHWCFILEEVHEEYATNWYAMPARICSKFWLVYSSFFVWNSFILWIVLFFLFQFTECPKMHRISSAIELISYSIIAPMISSKHETRSRNLQTLSMLSLTTQLFKNFDCSSFPGLFTGRWVYSRTKKVLIELKTSRKMGSTHGYTHFCALDVSAGVCWVYWWHFLPATICTLHPCAMGQSAVDQ